MCCVFVRDSLSVSYTGTLETAIHFVIYEHLKKMMVINNQRELELTECMLAAAGAKMTASSLCYPHGETYTHTHTHTHTHTMLNFDYTKEAKFHGP